MDIRGGVRLGPTFFRDAMRAPFWSFALSFCNILLKSLLITLEDFRGEQLAARGPRKHAGKPSHLKFP